MLKEILTYLPLMCVPFTSKFICHLFSINNFPHNYLGSIDQIIKGLSSDDPQIINRLAQDVISLQSMVAQSLEKSMKNDQINDSSRPLEEYNKNNSNPRYIQNQPNIPQNKS